MRILESCTETPQQCQQRPLTGGRGSLQDMSLYKTGKQRSWLHWDHQHLIISEQISREEESRKTREAVREP